MAVVIELNSDLLPGISTLKTHLPAAQNPNYNGIHLSHTERNFRLLTKLKVRKESMTPPFVHSTVHPGKHKKKKTASWLRADSPVMYCVGTGGAVGVGGAVLGESGGDNS